MAVEQCFAWVVGYELYGDLGFGRHQHDILMHAPHCAASRQPPQLEGVSVQMNGMIIGALILKA